MPTIATFYGILIYMYTLDNKQHHAPHIHAEYAGQKIVLRIPDGEILDGKIPPKQLKFVRAWIALHEDDLMLDWKLAISGTNPLPIKPLE